MPPSLLIFIFQPTRLNSFSLEVGSRGFLSPSNFETILSLTLQIARNCSSFRLWSLSPCYSLLICRLSLPIWPVLAYTATSHHPFFRLVNLIFFWQQDPLGGITVIITFHILFYFISFCRLLPSAILFSFLLFETCMQAWRSTGGWRCTHDSLFISLILIFCTVTPQHQLSVPCIISFLLLRIL